MMPLPLGHATIGFTIHHLFSRDDSSHKPWKIAFLIVILSNLPDLDVLIGLVLHGNGLVYHRGPTHSLLFSLLVGILASRSSRLWSQIPKMDFWICFAVVSSHVMSDLVFTSSPVSLFWPFEVHWACGYKGWLDVMNSVFFSAFRDAGIIAVCVVLMALKHIILRYSVKFNSMFK
jgi:inner membrane protein